MKKKVTLRIASILMSFMMMGNVLYASPLKGESTKQTNWKDKISQEVLDEMDKEETVKVCVWYEDINQASVEEFVEKKTGITQESLDTNLRMPNNELLTLLKEAISSVDNEVLIEKCKSKMQNYLAETKKGREKEDKKVKTYKNTRREYSKKQYKKKAKQVLDNLQVEDGQIEYVSNYAPMTIMELSKKEIKEIAKDDSIESIGLYREAEAVAESEDVSVNEMKETNGYNKICQQYGLTGQGVKLAILDLGLIYGDEQISEERIKRFGSSSSTDTHQIEMAHIAAGKDGMASDVMIYSMDANAVGFYKGVEILIDNEVDVINYSMGDLVRKDFYDSKEKWLDHVARIHGVTFVKSAGNFGGEISPPGLACNIITVGGMTDNGTLTQLDDILYEGSAYDNYSGCEKPDIVVSQNVLKGGTSSATAVVSGIVALMFELDPSLKAHPETVKAILCASCHRKVIDSQSGTQTEFMKDGITDKQGAGEVDLAAVFNIISKKQFVSGILKGDTAEKEIVLDIDREKLSYTNLSFT